MDKEKLDDLIIDYIDGRLNQVDKQIIEKELTSNAEAFKRYEEYKEILQMMDRPSRIDPNEELKVRFEQALQEEIKAKEKTRTVFFAPILYRVAAAVALVMVAGYAGYWISQNQKKQDDLMALQKEVELTKQLVMSRLDNEQSATQRILGVMTANEADHADDEIVSVLIRTMNADPNSNVRIAAVEALGKFHREPNVKAALIKSLGTQTDPVVQIALIQLMVQMKEKGAVESMERITQDEKVLQAVKDEAYAGVLKLSEI
jgi:hypothetical protein